MKNLTIILALLIGSPGALPAEVVLGGEATRNVENWTTSSVLFEDVGQSGHSLNWENVLANAVAIDAVENEFDLTWEAGVDHTMGHLFMYDDVLDLSTLANGIERFYWVANFETTAFPNWSPVISVTNAGETRYYRWNHSGNDWSGNGSLNFSAPFDDDDPYRFDLSQLGNGSSPATGIWGELNASADNFGGTRDNPVGPDLQATSGEVRFGFLQWTASSAAALEETSLATAIDCFQVIINADPGTPPEVEIAGAAEVRATSAAVSGALPTFGTDFSNLTLYYGESEGGTDPAQWSNSLFLGAEGCLFSVELTELARGTDYFYRFFAENSAGSDWSDAAGSFTTALATPPSVSVSEGSSAQPGSATFVGEVIDTGNEDPIVTLFYGSSDGGTNPGSWDAVLDLGEQGATFAATVEDLLGTTTYFYRAFAENSAGAAWSPTTQSVTTLAFQEVSGQLDSADFDFRYEMDENPALQNLDGAGNANDWFPNSAQAVGVDREMLIPQTYLGGIAVSDQEAAIPEGLFRTDYGGSISRESLSGDFTVETAVRLKAGTILSPEFDLGGFGIFVNPPGERALRLNIHEDEVSLGEGEEVVPTGSNTDSFHLFRVSCLASDQRYRVWRDGLLIYGGDNDLTGTADSLFPDGGLFLGDFAVDLSGDWEVDYIRLHNEAVAPTGVLGNLIVTDVGLVNPTTFFIEFQSRPNTAHQVMSSTDLKSFETTEDLFNGADGTTDESGFGRAEFDISGRLPGSLFFRVEVE